MIMKYSVVCALLAVVVAAPTDDAQSKIIKYENHNDGLGNYDFSYETSNGIHRSESGKLVNVGQPDEHIEVQGVYSYTDPNEDLVVVYYTADQNGYHIMPPPQTILAGAISPNVVASLLG